MRYSVSVALVSTVCLLHWSLPHFASASESSSTWDYEGKDGPDFWEKKYPQCASEKRQSPIDLEDVDGESTGIVLAQNQTAVNTLAWLNFPSESKQTVNITWGGQGSGHLEIGSFANATALRTEYDGYAYQLEQFHVHTPSEHRVANVFAPMEVHFVHKLVPNSGNGKAAADKKPEPFLVIGVFMEIAETASQADPANIISSVQEGLEQLVKENVTTLPLSQPLNFRFMVQNGLKDFSAGYWTYKGSLTTPPCLEQVQWVVAKNRYLISVKQFNFIKNTIGFNARPTQSRNATSEQLNGQGIRLGMSNGLIGAALLTLAALF